MKAAFGDFGATGPVRDVRQLLGGGGQLAEQLVELRGQDGDLVLLPEDASPDPQPLVAETAASKGQQLPGQSGQPLDHKGAHQDQGQQDCRDAGAAHGERRQQHGLIGDLAQVAEDIGAGQETGLAIDVLESPVDLQHVFALRVDDDRGAEGQCCTGGGLQHIEVRRIHRPEVDIDGHALRQYVDLLSTEMARQEQHGAGVDGRRNCWQAAGGDEEERLAVMIETRALAAGIDLGHEGLAAELRAEIVWPETLWPAVLRVARIPCDQTALPAEEAGQSQRTGIGFGRVRWRPRVRGVFRCHAAVLDGVGQFNLERMNFVVEGVGEAAQVELRVRHFEAFEAVQYDCSQSPGAGRDHEAEDYDQKEGHLKGERVKRFHSR